MYFLKKGTSTCTYKLCCEILGNTFVQITKLKKDVDVRQSKIDIKPLYFEVLMLLLYDGGIF